MSDPISPDHYKGAGMQEHVDFVAIARAERAEAEVERISQSHLHTLNAHGDLMAEVAALREDSKRLDWLADQYRRERKSYSDASVATGDKPWPMDEVTLLVHRDDGKIEPIDGPTFRAAIDSARAKGAT